VIKVRKGDLVFYQFSNLASRKNLIHFVTTRIGGASAPPYHSLNLAQHVGDKPDSVAENRKRILDVFGLRAGNLVWGAQTHGGNFALLDDGLGGGGARFGGQIADCDGLITTKAGPVLAVFSADCPLIILYHPGEALAVLHAGWRCILKKICARAVGFMIARLGCDPLYIKAGISPSIGPSSYVVRQDFAGEFRKAKLHADCIISRKGAFYFDLWKAAVDQIASSGVPRENVEISGIDSSSRPDEFYSARREGVTGRFALMAALLPGDQ